MTKSNRIEEIPHTERSVMMLGGVNSSGLWIFVEGSEYTAGGCDFII